MLNTAKAAAYSGMLMLFPAFIVLTALLAKAPEGPTVVGEIRWVSGQILPADTVRLMLSSMQARNPHPARLIGSGLALSVFAGLGLMLTLMEGFRRAYRLPRNDWRFWERRVRALFLVFIVLVPLALATLLLVFGRAIELWMVFNAGHELRYLVLLFWRMARWSLAFVTSLAVLGALYHFGTKRREHWLHVMPGAVAADGRLYIASEDGEIFVVSAGPDLKQIASNDMHEVIMATPAISDGLIVVRTLGHLYGIGE